MHPQLEAEVRAALEQTEERIGLEHKGSIADRIRLLGAYAEKNEAAAKRGNTNTAKAQARAEALSAQLRENEREWSERLAATQDEVDRLRTMLGPDGLPEDVEGDPCVLCGLPCDPRYGMIFAGQTGPRGEGHAHLWCAHTLATAEREKLKDFTEWVLWLDTPQGTEERRRVTMTKVIDRAEAALRGQVLA